MNFLNRAHSLTLPPYKEALFWIIHLQEIQEIEVHEAKRCLDPESVQRAQRLHLENQHRFVLTHAILRVLLASYLQKEMDEIQILRTDLGKPYLKHHPLHFNLAHKKEYAFLGIHPHSPIGVDIEKVQDLNFLKLSDIFLQPSERELLQSRDNPQDYFFTLWAAKEAVVKALGTGFSVEPLPLLHPLDKPAVHTHLFGIEGLKVHVYEGIVEDHKLAVCVKTTP